MIQSPLAAVAAVLLAACAWTGRAQSASPELRCAYESLRDAMYNDEPLEKLERLYEQALQVLAQAGLPAGAQALWRSRIEFMLARGYDARSDKPKAWTHYEQSLAYAEAVLEQDPLSEAWRLRSESLGHLCLVRGLGFLLANGRKAISYAKKALAIDPQNASAWIILAASKINLPAAGVRR